jgi:hypothetical protein
VRPEVFALEGRQMLSRVITVTSAADSDTGPTLRSAVDAADVSKAPVTIDFDLPTPATITLTEGPLDLSNAAAAITIEGPGAGLLTVDGDDKDHVFNIKPNVKASISGLTVSGGANFDLDGDGAVYNEGTLALTGVTVSNNTAGAVYMNGGNTMTLTD